MAIEDSSDLAANFFYTDDFAVAAIYRPQVSAASTVNGILRREPALLLDGAAGPGVRSQQPTFMCATADLPYVEQDATLEVAGTTYRIADVEPDGAGVTKIFLEED